jgi:hypothetical protein
MAHLPLARNNQRLFEFHSEERKMHTQQSAMRERASEEMVVGVWEGNSGQLGAHRNK